MSLLENKKQWVEIHARALWVCDAPSLRGVRDDRHYMDLAGYDGDMMRAWKPTLVCNVFHSGPGQW